MCNQPRQEIQPILIEGQSIIDFLVTSPASNRLVRRMIPVLVEIASNNEVPITYGELSRRIQHGTPRIGFQLGCIIDVLECLSQHLNKQVPCLTGLCVLQSTYLPGDSIDRLIPGYQHMPVYEKQRVLEGMNQKAYDYEHWDDVLAYLGL